MIHAKRAVPPLEMQTLLRNEFAEDVKNVQTISPQWDYAPIERRKAENAW